jgi:hypothetical protein
MMVMIMMSDVMMSDVMMILMMMMLSSADTICELSLFDVLFSPMLHGFPP